MGGYLNLVGLFQAEAASLLHAVQRGGLIHKTRNIKDSGALLETRFREIRPFCHSMEGNDEVQRECDRLFADCTEC